MDDESDHPPVTINQMKEMIGSLFFVWADVERALEDALTGIGPSPRGGPRRFSDKLKRWTASELTHTRTERRHVGVDETRRRLEEALEVRNCIAHGLVGWRANPFGGATEAVYKTELNGTPREITYSELENCVVALLELTPRIRDTGRLET